MKELRKKLLLIRKELKVKRRNKMINKVFLVGRIGKISDSKKHFTIVTELSKKQNDEWINKSTWHSVVIGKEIKNQVGDLVALEGSIDYGEYQGKPKTTIFTYYVKTILRKNRTEDVQGHSSQKDSVEVWKD